MIRCTATNIQSAAIRSNDTTVYAKQRCVGDEVQELIPAGVRHFIEQSRLLFLYQTGAGTGMPNKVVTSHFTKLKTIYHAK